MGTSKRPRMSVYRSLRFTSVQMVDDALGKTVLSATDKDLPKDTKTVTKTKRAFQLGEMVAKNAQKIGVTQVVFDRSGYAYSGRVKALAQGARKGGLKL